MGVRRHASKGRRTRDRCQRYRDRRQDVHPAGHRQARVPEAGPDPARGPSPKNHRGSSQKQVPGSARGREMGPSRRLAGWGFFQYKGRNPSYQRLPLGTHSLVGAPRAVRDGSLHLNEYMVRVACSTDMHCHPRISQVPSPNAFWAIGSCSVLLRASMGRGCCSCNLEPLSIN